MNYLKNRKGSTLALTIIIFAVLIISATFILGFMVTENKQSVYHQNKTQSYYIAKSAADVVDSAIRIQLRKAYTSGGSQKVNEYINNKLNGLDVELFTDDDLEKLGADSLNARTLLVDSGDSKLLAIDVIADYKGVTESIRKIVTSYLTVSSTNDGKFEHQGLPIVATEAAWRNDKDGLTDLSDPSKNNGKTYAEIAGDSTIFKNAVIPSVSWDTNGIQSAVTNPTISGSSTINFKNSKVTLSNDYELDSDVQNIYVFGDLEISGRFETKGKVNVYVMGGLYINGSVRISSTSNKSEDINFYVYYQDRDVLTTSLNIDNLHSGYETRADFYVQRGKTRVMFKKNTFYGNISSNDAFAGSLGSNGLPSNPNEYNVMITSDDSSNQISFYGSVWAPDSYVIMGGSISGSKNAIPQKGLLLGKYIEVEGLNHKKNYDYLDTLLKNSGDSIQVPGEIESESTIQVLRFKSYYVDIPK